MSIAVAKACGSSTVFATETNEQRRAMAKKMGADVVLNPAKEDAVGKILADTGGTGVDALLEMSGKSDGDSAGFPGAASGWARVAAGDSDRDCAAGSSERRDFQRRDGAGDLWAANV